MNAMSLDIAMGGSTNTVLHLLAIAQEAGVDFTMKDIDDAFTKNSKYLQSCSKFTLSCSGCKPGRWNNGNNG